MPREVGAVFWNSPQNKQPDATGYKKTTATLSDDAVVGLPAVAI